MSQAKEPPDAFTMRFAELRALFLTGLAERAIAFRACIEALHEGAPDARAKARELAHRLAGIAGTYDCDLLGSDARACEDAILADAPNEAIAARLARLADDCDALTQRATPIPQREDA